jgi:hypothetical protein
MINHRDNFTLISAGEFNEALERRAKEGKSGTENCTEHEELFWKI